MPWTILKQGFSESVEIFLNFIALLFAESVLVSHEAQGFNPETI